MFVLGAMSCYLYEAQLHHLTSTGQLLQHKHLRWGEAAAEPREPYVCCSFCSGALCSSAQLGTACWLPLALLVSAVPALHTTPRAQCLQRTQTTSQHRTSQPLPAAGSAVRTVQALQLQDLSIALGHWHPQRCLEGWSPHSLPYFCYHIPSGSPFPPLLTVRLPSCRGFCLEQHLAVEILKPHFPGSLVLWESCVYSWFPCLRSSSL